MKPSCCRRPGISAFSWGTGTPGRPASSFSGQPLCSPRRSPAVAAPRRLCPGSGGPAAPETEIGCAIWPAGHWPWTATMSLSPWRVRCEAYRCWRRTTVLSGISARFHTPFASLLSLNRCCSVWACTLAAHGVGPVQVWYDEPMSRSGELAAATRRLWQDCGSGQTRRRCRFPKNSSWNLPGVIGSSDTALIDRVEQVADVAGEIIRQLPQVRIMALAGTEAAEIHEVGPVCQTISGKPKKQVFSGKFK